MKRSLRAGLAVLIASLSWGPMATDVFARVVVQSAPAGSGSAASAAGAAAGPSQNGVGGVARIPSINFQAGLASVGSVSAQITPSLSASVPALPAAQASALYAPVAEKMPASRFASPSGGQQFDASVGEKGAVWKLSGALSKTAESLGLGSASEAGKKNESASGVSAGSIKKAFGRWRAFFDASARRENDAAQTAPYVSRRPRLAALRLSGARGVAQTGRAGERFKIKFAAEFESSVLRLNKTRPSRWSKAQWSRLNQGIQRFADGQSARKIQLAKRDPARSAGIWKFKWADEDLRVFFHYDAAKNTLTMLEAKDKKELLAEGENDYYEMWAAEAGSIPSRWINPDAEAALQDELGPIRLRDLNDGRNPGARGLSVFERGANAVTGHNGSAEGESGLKNPFGRSVSGLAPPVLKGHRRLSEYRLPSSIAGRRSAYLLAHAVLIAAGLASSALAFGWVPFLAGISAVAADLYWTFKVFGYGDDGAHAFQSNMFGDAKNNYQAYVEAVYRALLSRMDIDPASAPRLSINNRFGDRFGGVIDTDGSSDRFVISVGEGFAELPAEQLAAVLAHELGHWYFKDFGAARLLRSRVGWEFGMETIKKILVYGLLLHVAGVFGVPASLAVIVSAAGIAFTAGAAPGVSAALMHWRQKLSEAYPEDWPSVATIAAGALVFAAEGSHFIHLGIGFDVPAALIDPAFIAVSAGWAALSATLTAVGLYFGVAVQRQEEFRADHFGGWASDRRWLADYLRTASAADAGGMRHSVYESILNRFLHSHPEAKRRIAQLD